MQQKKLAVAIAAAYGIAFAYAPSAQAQNAALLAVTGISDTAVEASAAASAVGVAVAANGATNVSANAASEAAQQGAAASAVAADVAQVIASVTVSTRRRNETSQSVPTTMSVLDDKSLENNRIYRVQDLQQLLPSTTVNFVHARQLSFAVRGLGNNTASDGLEGSVGLYLDNVYLARPGMAAFDALDVQQLELLRGPQGTLFGKNTTAGVLNITTKQPTFRSENTASLSVGQDHYQRLPLLELHAAQ